ncbi:putative receptor protein kinase ZmPK1 [Amaranthus tricolor]|uniref:putative receptor protein kinase ZmPK1 n=1 Tax=Amaranthus tricolor TaxID=29722 RepID=UPI002589509A|nr:putative receptor protein kinase ZmPK1 [Amaranthus tricolor]
MSFPLIIFFIIILPFSTSLTFSSFNISNSPWLPSQNRILVSPQNSFSAGFQALPTSSNLFIFSIWYSNTSYNVNHNTPTIIWSANWGFPVHYSASLIITSDGELRLLNDSSRTNFWQNPPSRNFTSTKLLLQDDGNLVFGSWESFLYPTDTFLPNQNITKNTTLTSKNGKFSFIGSNNLVFQGSDSYCFYTKEFLSLWDDGRVVRNGGNPITSADFGSKHTRRLILEDDGNLRILSFYPHRRKWVVVWVALLETCQAHGLCGPGYICYSDGSTSSGYKCVCPPGFKKILDPESCVPKIPIDPENSKFLRLDYVNYSGGSTYTNLMTYSFDKCRSKCVEEQKCHGFGFKYDGSGYCVLQMNRLVNGYWSPNTEMSFYLRVHQLETDPSNFTGMSEVLDTTCPTLITFPNPYRESNKTTLNIIIVTIIFTFEIASGVLLFWTFLKKYVKYRDMVHTLGLGLFPTAGAKRFTYGEIKLATKDFSEENFIGKGGFGNVYAGVLRDGRPVAVKCLKDVQSGESGFWAEVTIIARMHHLNLVRLWGFCDEKGQRILIYEHVPNGSLDKYLFKPGLVRLEDRDSDPNTTSMSSVEQTCMLDWNIRYRIALGVARAIAYLHEECLEWVLHCDIKPENILLGDDFCPKVADFGLSKLRKKEQLVTRSNIRGTRGYMAPEWTKHEPLTSKVDVYSFGMVLLEIVTGVRNTTEGPSWMPSEEWYFPKWVFKLGIEENRMDEILDRQIKHCYDDNVHFNLISRMVKTAMWCLQERPEMRPSMGKVAKMLEGTVEIMEPPKPTLFYL